MILVSPKDMDPVKGLYLVGPIQIRAFCPTLTETVGHMKNAGGVGPRHRMTTEKPGKLGKYVLSPVRSDLRVKKARTSVSRVSGNDSGLEKLAEV